MAKNEHIERLFQCFEGGEEAATAEMLALFEGEERSFGPGFEGRVMAAIQPAKEPGVLDFVPRMFKWVALAGVAAAVALLMMTWQAEAGLDMDAFAGITEISLEDMTALNDF